MLEYKEKSKKLHTYKYPRPAVTTDIVIFSIHDDELQVVLIERGKSVFQGEWALPGGFLRENEDLKECALRELREEVGISADQLSTLPLRQIGAFGTPGRDPRGHTVTVAFMTIAPLDKHALYAGSDAKRAKWFPVDRLPSLAFDHADILACARASLREVSSTDFTPDPNAILPFLEETFTLSEAQNVMEIVQGRTFDKPNFRKWITKTWPIEETGEMKPIPGTRPAKLYKLTS